MTAPTTPAEQPATVMESVHGGIGVRSLESGETQVCAEAGLPGNYHTLCGLSLDDDTYERVPVPLRARINCGQCKQVWLAARKFVTKDFV